MRLPCFLFTFSSQTEVTDGRATDERNPHCGLPERNGIHPTKQKGNALWHSAPYRTERTPSFKVDTNKNVWFDFGIGKGGDIFDLAGEFVGCEDFLLRAAFIAKSGTCPHPVMPPPTKK